MPKVVITQTLSQTVVDTMRAALGNGVEIAMVQSQDAAELARFAAGAEVFLNAYRKVDAHFLSQAPQARFIQQMGVGYNNLDLAALKKAGVQAANTPGVNTAAVAEHTVLLILAWLKRFRHAEAVGRDNRFPLVEMTQLGIDDLETATVGLVGLGAIGQATAERLRPFGPTLLYTARHRADPALEDRLGVRYVELPELLATSSIVSLHMALNDQTRHFIGAAELAQMQPRAILVNTGRGELVDEVALRQALDSGKLAGAALDVLENEHDGGNPFTDLSQVIVTPHTGGLSRAATGRVFRLALGNITRYFAGQPLQNLL